MDQTSINYLETIEHLLQKIQTTEPKSQDDIEPFLNFERELNALIHTQKIILENAQNKQKILTESIDETKQEIEHLTSEIESKCNNHEIIMKNKQKLESFSRPATSQQESKTGILSEIRTLEFQNEEMEQQLCALQNKKNFAESQRQNYISQEKV